MILEGIFNVIFAMFDGVVSILPDFSGIDLGFLDTALSVISGVCYFLPMGTVGAIFAILVSLMAFRIAVSLIKTLWELLPIL